MFVYGMMQIATGSNKEARIKLMSEIKWKSVVKWVGFYPAELDHH
jgi:hypothetical protein